MRKALMAIVPALFLAGLFASDASAFGHRWHGWACRPVGHCGFRVFHRHWCPCDACCDPSPCCKPKCHPPKCEPKCHPARPQLHHHKHEGTVILKRDWFNREAEEVAEADAEK